MSSGADYHRDALQAIVERIPLHKDVLRFAAVCKQWTSIVVDNLHRIPHKLPLRYCLPRQHPLPLLTQCNDDEVVGKMEFLSVLDKKSFTGFSVPEISGYWIVGSSNGWLVLVEILGQKINLLNPLTRAQIPLPSLFSFKHLQGILAGVNIDFESIQKALVIPEPNAGNKDRCVVIAILPFPQKLFFCRTGYRKWLNIKGSPVNVDDIISCKGHLYAVTNSGALVSFDVEDQRVTLVAGFATKEHEHGRSRKSYLVESTTSGDLLGVVRIQDDKTYSTVGFSVYKIEKVDDELKIAYILPDGVLVEQAVEYQWVEQESLDDQILFIGRNYSKSVSASLFPELNGNCIYFTDDDEYGRHSRVAWGKAAGFGVYVKDEKYDMGIYDMGEESIRPIGSMDGRRFRLPPVWVEPNPW